MRKDKTDLTVVGLGALVSGIGASTLRSRVGAGVLGFGLAHVALGLLDMMVRKK